VPLRPVVPIVLVVLVVLAGCGDSSSKDETRAPAPPIGASARSCETHTVDAEGLRATGVACGQARAVMYGWQRTRSCASPAGASRGSCTALSYRCLTTKTDRGVAVSCARPGRSIAFVATLR
jgi:hypothetical protein